MTITLEIKDWIIEDIEYDSCFEDGAYFDDGSFNKTSEEYKKTIEKEIEYAYKNKHLSTAIENFLYDWNKQKKPSPSFNLKFMERI